MDDRPPPRLDAASYEAIQFERIGYFCVDRDSTAARPVLNRTATLKDTWKKVQQKQG